MLGKGNDISAYIPTTSSPSPTGNLLETDLQPGVRPAINVGQSVSGRGEAQIKA